MSKPTVEIVGSHGEKVLYVQFFKNGQPEKNGLWKLQHPGNTTVDSWEESIVKKDEDGLRFSTKVMTQNFFKCCVFPVDDPITEIETELVKEYGANERGKIKSPDELGPLEYGVWQKLQTRFYSGDLWADVPEPKKESEPAGAGRSG